MDRIRTSLSTSIKRRREGLKLSQMKFAEMAGLSVSYVAEIEGGSKFPSSTSIEKIADALDLEPSELFVEIEKRTRKVDASAVVAEFARDVGEEITKAVERTAGRYLKRRAT